MPCALPPEIQKAIKSNLPSGCEMLWARGVVGQGIKQEMPTASHHPYPNKPFSIIPILDVEQMLAGTGTLGYDVTVNNPPRSTKIQEGDAVSLFGVKCGRSKFVPRYLINHNTGLAHPIYTVEKAENFAMPQSCDGWLKINVPGGVGKKLRNIFLCGLVILMLGSGFLVDPLTAYQNTGEVSQSTLTYISVLLVIWIVAGLLVSRNSTQNFDATDAYKKAAIMTHDGIHNHLFEPFNFVIDWRGN